MTDLESLLAEALCGGHRAPCRYHVTQAKVALNALAGAGMVVVPLHIYNRPKPGEVGYQTAVMARWLRRYRPEQPVAAE